jgi:hypothetical protein
MDDRRFDRLATALSAGPSRRWILRWGSGGLVALLTRLALPSAAAKQKRHKHKKKCSGGKKKCGKRCIPRTNCCAASDCPAPPPCQQALCQEDQCLTVPLPQDTPCASGPSCVVNQTCNGVGECQGGSPDDARCPSSNPCRAGRCDPADPSSDQDSCVFDPIDNGTLTCGTGACQRTVARCVDGEEQPCVPGQPTTETCNGIDDDCDGIVDGPGLCPVDDPATCGFTGICDGGACRRYGVETICRPTSCEGSTQHLAARCNGSGTCPASQTRSCAPYICHSNGVDCIGSCGGDTDCIPPNVCILGQCRSKKENGEACQLPSQCKSGFCVLSVCCDTACTGASICTGGVCHDI